MRKAKGRMFLYEMINVILMTTIFGVVWHHEYFRFLNDSFYQQMEPAVLLVFSFLYFLFGYTYEGFRIDVNCMKEIVFSQGMALFLTDGLMFFMIWIIEKRFPSPVPAAAAAVCQLLVSVIYTFCMEEIRASHCQLRKTAVLYYELRDRVYLKNIETLSGKFHVEKWIQVSGHAEIILKELEGMDAVFMRGLPSDEKNTVLKYCLLKNIEVYLYPKIGDVLVSGAEQVHMFYAPVMRLNRFEASFMYVVLKRAMDIMASMAGLLLLAPLFLIIAALVKGYDGGPVFYRQTRLTENGRRFEICKFRSMRMDAERDGIARLAQEQDIRITPVGRWIRSTHLDELPQLFNILKGDMTLVGPRPERPEIAEDYTKEIPEFALRLQVKAGLTGYAQVYGKYNSTPYEKLQMDLWYISHSSIWMDLKLVLMTVKTLFFRENSQGIRKGQITAYPEQKIREEIKE